MDEQISRDSTGITLSDVAIGQSDRQIDLPQINGLTERQSIFMVHYMSSGNVSESCRKANIDRRTYYNWRSDNSVFRDMVKKYWQAVIEMTMENRTLACHEAIEVLRGQLCSHDENIRRAAAKTLLESGDRIMSAASTEYLRVIGEELARHERVLSSLVKGP